MNKDYRALVFFVLPSSLLTVTYAWLAPQRHYQATISVTQRLGSK